MARAWSSRSAACRSDQLAAYGAGWQVHAEDLAAHVAGRERDEDEARWVDMVPAYQEMLGA